MKSMVYHFPSSYFEVLDTGYFFTYLYFILNLGTHPCAYVRIPKSHKFFNVNDYNSLPINCHGGLSYMDNFIFINNHQRIKGKFIGWDYSHIGDFNLLCSFCGGKKWTTEEILKDVKNVCKQLKKFE